MSVATASCSVGRNTYAGSATGGAYSVASGGTSSGVAYGGFMSNGGYGSNGVSSAVAGGANSLGGYVAEYNGGAPNAAGAAPLARIMHRR